MCEMNVTCVLICLEKVTFCVILALYANLVILYNTLSVMIYMLIAVLPVINLHIHRVPLTKV